MSIPIIVFILSSIVAYFVRPLLILAIMFVHLDKTLFAYFASEQYLLKVIVFSCTLSLIWSIKTYKANFRKVLIPTMENVFFLLYLSLTAGYYFYLNNDKLHSQGYFSIFVVGIFFYAIFSSLYKLVDKTVKKYETKLQFKTLFTLKLFQIYVIIGGIVVAIYLFYPLRNLMR